MKKLFIKLIIIGLVASFITFYTTNLFLSDVSQYFKGGTIITTLPGLLFSFDLVALTLYLIRKEKYKDIENSLMIRYFTILGIFSILGIISSILSSVMFYHTFVGPNPFPGYVLISLIVHTALLAFSIIEYIKVYKLKKEEHVEKRKFKYIVYTIIISFMFFYSFNRFGAFMWSLSFLQFKTLYMTFPFYLSLLMPITVCAFEVLNFLGYFEDNKDKLILSFNLIVLFDLLLGGMSIILGAINTEIISAISPFLGLERLATMPIDTIFQFILILGFSIYYLLVEVKNKKKTA